MGCFTLIVHAYRMQFKLMAFAQSVMPINTSMEYDASSANSVKLVIQKDVHHAMINSY